MACKVHCYITTHAVSAPVANAYDHDNDNNEAAAGTAESYLKIE